MYNKNKGSGNPALIIFVVSLAIAIIFFAAFGYIFTTSKGTEPVDKSIVTISKIVVFAGVFFLVIAFGYALPNMVKSRKNKDGVQADATDIFNEVTMRKALEKYIPDGETMLAGIHVAAKESSVTCAFEGCVITEDKLIPDANDNIVTVSKKKYCGYDLYLSITQHFLIMADCDAYPYYYEYNKAPVQNNADIQKVTQEIYLKDIGKCFRLDDIADCKMKNGFGGSVNCTITMKNGSYFKIILPTIGGLTGGMPHHKEYKDAIIACLSKYNV